MNHLIMFQSVQGGDAGIPDIEIRFEWRDAPPSVGDVVGMNGIKDWEIIKICQYSQVNAGAGLESEIGVFFCHVSRCDLEIPPEPDWIANNMAFYYPEQSAIVYLSEIGITELDFAGVMQGQQPCIGEELMSYFGDSGPKGFQPVKTGWLVQKFDTFTPLDKAPYKSIYLAWCEKSVAVPA